MDWTSSAMCACGILKPARFLTMRRLLAVCACAIAGACGTLADPHQLGARDLTPEAPATLTPQLRVQIIDTLLDLLATHYVDARRVDSITLATWRATLMAEALNLDSDAFWRRLDDQLGLLADSHTRLLPPSQVHARLTSSMPGLGGEPELSGSAEQGTAFGLRITRVQAGSAAAQHGVQPGWRLLKVGNEDFGTAWARSLAAGRSESTARATQERALQRMWQASGPPWSLVFDSPAGVTRNVTLAKTAITAQTYRDADGVVHISLPFIDEDAYEILTRTVREPHTALVLDLRGNRGGSGQVALRMLGLFVEREPLVARLQTRNGKPIRQGMTTLVPLDLHAAPRTDAYFDGPLTVWIDSGTASSAELLAGGLKMLGRARIVGRPSCGCMNPSLGWMNLPGGAQILIAEARATLADGTVIEGQGVQPHEAR